MSTKMPKKRDYSRSLYIPVSDSSNSNPEFVKTSVTICLFVILREFRPVESFFTSFLTEPPISLTTEQVNERVYPIGTYASFLLAVFMFLITDYLRYKPILILDAIAGILTYALLIGKPSLDVLFIEQICFGFFYSSDVSCNTYLYAKIEDSSQYQKITAYVRASSLFGRFVSGIFSQIVVSFRLFRKSDLNYCSAGGMVAALICAFMVPSVDRSIYFHRKNKTMVECTPVNTNQNTNTNDIKKSKLSVVTAYLWYDFKKAFTNYYVIKWSMWWALSATGYYYVLTYSQVLWQTVVDERHADKFLMNGAVDSISTVLGAIAACSIGCVKCNWREKSNSVLIIISIVLSGLILYIYSSQSLWMMYICYILYGIVFQTTLVIAQSEIAQRLEKDSYALIFGFNSFLTLTFCSIATYFVVEGRFIRLTTRQQFLFYGSLHGLIALLFAIVAIFDVFPRKLTNLDLI